MKLWIFLAVALVFVVHQEKKLTLEVGSKLPVREVPKKNRHLFMTHSSQLRPFIEREIDEIKYIIAYDEKTREITYLSTYDKAFKSAQGFRVGDYAEVKGNEVVAYPGWEIRAPGGEDGWQLLIGFNSEMTVWSDNNEVKLKLAPTQYNLPADQVLKAKIVAFVKGMN